MFDKCTSPNYGEDPNLYSLFLDWSGRWDSNSRPSAPKADALPGCATPRTIHILTCFIRWRYYLPPRKRSMTSRALSDRTFLSDIPTNGSPISILATKGLSLKVL